MTKVELIKSISEISTEEVSQKQVNAVLIALEEIVKDSVYCGHEAIIPGICKIKQKLIPERKGIVMIGVNKGEQWIKPEHMKASIKIASSLKNIFK